MDIKSVSQRQRQWYKINLTNSEQEVLVEMHCDSHMRDMFKQCHRTKFWAKAFTEEQISGH